MSWMRNLVDAYDDARRRNPGSQLMLVLDIDSAMQSDPHSVPGLPPVIRWFQLQPNTSIGLLSNRPETIRRPTLESLNREGALHEVAIDGANNALKLLHIDRTSRPEQPSALSTTAADTTYALTELIRNKDALPEGVDLVWHGVNDRINLHRFLASGVRWAEIDIRNDPSRRLILRHDSFETTPRLPNEDCMMYDEAIATLAGSASGVKLDIKGGAKVLDQVLQSVSDSGLTDDRLWFNGDIELISESGFRKIRAAHPGAIVQCPIGWLLPLILAAPDEARRILDFLIDWGIDRFSVNWQIGEIRELAQHLKRWGYGINIYGVRNLEEFLEAVMLLPRSVTADFNFPDWGLYGRGSGEGGVHFTYASDGSSGLL